MRVLGITLAALLAACAAPAPSDPLVERGRATAGSPLAQSRAVLVRDAAAILGRPALAEVRAAPAAILVRMPEQFPQREGRPPSVAAGVRTPAGWARITSGGEPRPFDRTASALLDHLLASPLLWAEPPRPDVMCTDPSGIVMLVRSGRREKVATYPCGFSGVTGQAGEIVLGGGIRDWSIVPPELRPSGIPYRRPSEIQPYRFVNGIHDERRLEIRSEAEWRGQWMRIHRDRNAVPPPVDFSRDMVLLAAMGSQPSGGYVLAIESILDRPDALIVFVRHTAPGPRCGAIAVVTSPLDAVVIPATAKPIRWIVERRVENCP